MSSPQEGLHQGRTRCPLQSQAKSKTAEVCISDLRLKSPDEQAAETWVVAPDEPSEDPSVLHDQSITLVMGNDALPIQQGLSFDKVPKIIEPTLKEFTSGLPIYVRSVEKKSAPPQFSLPAVPSPTVAESRGATTTSPQR